MKPFRGNTRNQYPIRLNMIRLHHLKLVLRKLLTFLVSSHFRLFSFVILRGSAVSDEITSFDFTNFPVEE